MIKKSTIRNFLASAASADAVAAPSIVRRCRTPWTRTILTGFILFLGIQLAAKADTMAYMLTDGADFGTIDLNTGVFSSIGSESEQLEGLGEIGSTVYGMTGVFGSPLYTINTTTGAATAIPGSGNPALEFTVFGSTLTNLYAIQANTGVLYSINSTTGAATDVGSTGITSFGGESQLSTNSNTLYLTDFTDFNGDFNEQLFTINTSTGAATSLGNTGGPRPGALIMEGSTLYGGENFPTYEIDTLNTTTGAATAGAAVTGTSGVQDFEGLAAIPATSAVPEPSSVSLLLLGLLTGGVCAKKRLSNRSSKQAA
jgi:hypothetical protein